MSKLFAGLDVSLDKTSICVVDARGNLVFENEAASTPSAISTALKPYRTLLGKVGHEAGIFTPWLHRELLRRKLPAICLDARKTRAALAAQRNKTDRNDARDIAIALARGFEGAAHVKSDEAHRIRMLLTFRRCLKRKANDIEMTLRTTLKVFGATTVRRGTAFTIKYATRRPDPLVAQLVKTALDARRSVQAEANRLESVAVKLARADAVCRRLMTIPGVGPLTALAFKAAVDDPRRFSSSRVVGSYFGLTPRRIQSGRTDFQTSISRQGDFETRAMLYSAASTMLSCCKKPSKFRTWGLKLVAANGFKHASVACARKLAVIMHRVWITETPFQPDHGGV